jgi:hypothetical protein
VLQLFHEAGNVVDRVAAVSVHLPDYIETVSYRPAEAVTVRRGEPEFPGASQNVNSGML